MRRPYCILNVLGDALDDFFFCRSRHLLQGTILERSRTENPVDSAALANRWSQQTKLLLAGRCPHHTKDAARCRPSAARKGC
jgi:hypothetical protein